MDKFNDIWKNRFNEKEAPNSAWNTPSADVWENIFSEITEEKEPKRGLFWLLYAGLVVAIILISYQSYLGLKEYTTALSQNIDQAEIATNFIEKNKEYITESTDSELISFDKEVSNKEFKRNHAAKKQLDKTEKNRPNIVSNSLQSSAYKNIENVIVSENTSFENTKIVGNIQEQQQNNPVAEKDRFGTSNIPSLEVQMLQTKISLPDLRIIEKKKSSKNPLYIGVSTGFVYWKHRLNSGFESALEPFEFSYEDNFGFNTQLILNYKLNDKLQLSTGLSYDRVNIQSGHNSALEYQLQDELDGAKNRYLLALATPYGFVDSEFDVKRVESISNENTQLNAAVHSTQLVQNIAIPISLKTKLITVSKFQTEISTGIGVNYMTKINSHLDRVNPNHTAFSYTEDETMTGSTNINHWHLDYRLGLHVNYSINKNTTLNLQYSYIKGLNAIYKTDDFSTKINRHYLSVAFIKALKR